MAFIDLNIPFLETTKSQSQNQTLKQARLKLLLRLIELGYTGVAYNRSIKGVISDADYCSIPLFTISSLLNLLPSLSTAAKIHRDVLGVHNSSPFRQYTRLTVSVDSGAQAAVLNSGNPVLKSYNVVASKPLNQTAFDEVCQKAEVDIITIDFSEKLPFRLKLPMIKAATQRGVYFEIAYCGLVRDVQTRFQVISNAKLLVDWTRGRNIILTSSASTVNELRGPYDIANLAFLLGVTMERAKAAVSRNCRDLVSKALRKRQYYKEAIKVEALSATEQLKFGQPYTDDWIKWDPISSGGGDFVLDDSENYLSAARDDTVVKALDFTSIVNTLPSNGWHLNDIIEEPIPLQQLQNQEAELSDQNINAENIEPVLSEPDGTVMVDTPEVDDQLYSDSVLQPNDLYLKDSVSEIKLLLAKQPSQAEGDDNVPLVANGDTFQLDAEDSMIVDTLIVHSDVEQLQSKSKDSIMPDTNLVTHPNNAVDVSEKSSLTRDIEIWELTTHVAINEEPTNSSGIVTPLSFGETGRCDSEDHGCDCVLNGKSDIMESYKGEVFSNSVEEAGVSNIYITDVSDPLVDQLKFQIPSTGSPENVDSPPNGLCCGSNKAFEEASPANKLVTEGGRSNPTLDDHVMNRRLLMESHEEIVATDSLCFNYSGTKEVIADECRLVHNGFKEAINEDDHLEEHDRTNTVTGDATAVKHRGNKRAQKTVIFPLKRLLSNTHFKKKAKMSKGKLKKNV